MTPDSYYRRAAVVNRRLWASLTADQRNELRREYRHMRRNLLVGRRSAQGVLNRTVDTARWTY